MESWQLQTLKLTTAVLTFLACTTQAKAADYRPIHEVCLNRKTSETVIAIRELSQSKSDKSLKLTVSPTSLMTAMVTSKDLKCQSSTVAKDGSGTLLYEKVVSHFNVGTSGFFVNANEGFKLFAPACALKDQASFGSLNEGLNAMALTIDLCPAGSRFDEKLPHRPFDRGYFESLRSFGKKTGRVVNATVFVSGNWIKYHRKEAAELVAFNNPSEGLALTFGNHSNTHPYFGMTVPSAQNFMTAMKASEFAQEVLNTEKAMLAAGMTPSVYFRFPGLMSNADELAELRTLGLIPVGASAWLAMDGGSGRHFAGFEFSSDQKPRAGRIILTHGNGNEEVGVRGKHGVLNFLEAFGQQTVLVPIGEAIRCSTK